MSSATSPAGSRQEQFLEVIDRDEAERRFRSHLSLKPLGTEVVRLDAALDRVLAVDIAAPVDVPGFDRSNVDGFAVRSQDTFGAMEESHRLLELHGELIEPGMAPSVVVAPGTAVTIATGGMLPRGADAVVMIEHTELEETERDALGGFRSAVRPRHTEDARVRVLRAVAPGENVSFAGSDMARGETVCRAGQTLSSREIGVLAALGFREVTVYRKPRVGILSTGNELVAGGEPLAPGQIYDSNGPMLAAAVRELGGEPVVLGIVGDDEAALSAASERGLECDVLLLSGGTSKGAGDLSHRIVGQLRDPGIVVHGVALKPGKPLCLAVTRGKPVAVLPGFPTSALFTFHEFLAPVIRALAGRAPEDRPVVEARTPVKIASEKGRTEYLLVNLVPDADGRLQAFPLGKGSGSVTTFSLADGFIAIPAHTEIIPAETAVEVRLTAHAGRPADLVAIGSHCMGLDLLLGRLQREGFVVKSLWVGSTAGLHAAKRGHCDVAGIHLPDPTTGEYNTPFLDETVGLIRGYTRMQGVVFRPEDRRFVGCPAVEGIARAVADETCVMVNRNGGSGTRMLIDEALRGAKPPGYAAQVKSHNAVAAAIAQGRADWGVAIAAVARMYGLGFLPLREEHYDFVIPRGRDARPAVRRLAELLEDAEVRAELRALGCEV
jgi:putative molybdopterin biosynthesis protein